MEKENVRVKEGDIIWVELKGASNNYGHGEVISTYFDEKVGFCFEFFCLVNGGRRTGKEKDLIKKPNNRMLGKVMQNQKEIREVLKSKR